MTNDDAEASLFLRRRRSTSTDRVKMDLAPPIGQSDATWGVGTVPHMVGDGPAASASRRGVRSDMEDHP